MSAAPTPTGPATPTTPTGPSTPTGPTGPAAPAGPAARDEVLARVRAALGAGSPSSGSPSSSSPGAAVPRDYRRAGSTLGDLALLTHRLVDYQATVLTATPQTVVAVIQGAVVDPVLVAPGLPDGWAPPGATVDAGFTAAELDGFATVITTAAAAAAETGTIVLDASTGQGRRAISLVPDRHVCVLRADQVVPGVPDLLARLDPHRPLTFISGPSATSDIELSRVEGVHGPRTLIVILLSP